MLPQTKVVIAIRAARRAGLLFARLPWSLLTAAERVCGPDAVDCIAGMSVPGFPPNEGEVRVYVRRVAGGLRSPCRERRREWRLSSTGYRDCGATRSLERNL